MYVILNIIIGLVGIDKNVVECDKSFSIHLKLPVALTNWMDMWSLKCSRINKLGISISYCSNSIQPSLPCQWLHISHTCIAINDDPNKNGFSRYFWSMCGFDCHRMKSSSHLCWCFITKFAHATQVPLCKSNRSWRTWKTYKITPTYHIMF